MGFRFIIQSEREPAYLEGRIESFLREYRATLEEMTQAEFEGRKRSLQAITWPLEVVLLNNPGLGAPSSRAFQVFQKQG